MESEENLTTVDKKNIFQDNKNSYDALNLGQEIFKMARFSNHKEENELNLSKENPKLTQVVKNNLISFSDKNNRLQELNKSLASNIKIRSIDMSEKLSYSTKSDHKKNKEIQKFSVRKNSELCASIEKELSKTEKVKNNSATKNNMLWCSPTKSLASNVNFGSIEEEQFSLNHSKDYLSIRKQKFS